MSSDDEKKIDASVSAEEVEKAKAEIAEEVRLFVFIICVNDFIIFWDVVLVHMFDITSLISIQHINL